jgi:hypothetical protein
MGLPFGSPTGACWAAARPAKRATMAVWANMLTVVVGIMVLTRRRENYMLG